ncbi:hypothetical protein DACRYDRAFT_19680 [Dacryopinax primogenitus]|uniref:Uncharacterized protein n=1 Tax=Dacryopinax primogenitus (strain DJM 731) TaxID=1858805 RepID=M5G8Q9_DACPD|nr:uncharacterized protein DACRYDRAFT_19680 [Dacryopinax primogenitus]EJU06596.1 hypothetical protein DACRYDRAFT_19680 [Dacryopinax primogenitus]
MAIKSSSRLELPISQFCSLVSRCPQLRYIHVPFSLDFPRGLLPDARLVVPKLQYLFAEGLNCSDMASAKAYIPLNLPKLDRVLATGIDNKVQEVLDDLRITFNFPDADTLADLRLQLAGDEQPLRRQVLRSLFRRPKKRYLRAKPVRRELITIKQERTDETLFDDQPEDQVLEIRLTDLELPILVEPPPSPRTILSASDIPSAFRSSVSSLSEESPPSATSIYVSD